MLFLAQLGFTRSSEVISKTFDLDSLLTTLNNSVTESDYPSISVNLNSVVAIVGDDESSKKICDSILASTEEAKPLMKLCMCEDLYVSRDTVVLLQLLSRYYPLRVSATILEHPQVVGYLLGSLEKSKSEFLRNECLILLSLLVHASRDFQTILIFQNGAESLLSLVVSEIGSTSQGEVPLRALSCVEVLCGNERCLRYMIESDLLSYCFEYFDSFLGNLQGDSILSSHYREFEKMLEISRSIILASDGNGSSVEKLCHVLFSSLFFHFDNLGIPLANFFINIFQGNFFKFLVSIRETREDVAEENSKFLYENIFSLLFSPENVVLSNPVRNSLNELAWKFLEIYSLQISRSFSPNMFDLSNSGSLIVLLLESFNFEVFIDSATIIFTAILRGASEEISLFLLNLKDNEKTTLLIDKFTSVVLTNRHFLTLRLLVTWSWKYRDASEHLFTQSEFVLAICEELKNCIFSQTFSSSSFSSYCLVLLILIFPKSPSGRAKLIPNWLTFDGEISRKIFSILERGDFSDEFFRNIKNSVRYKILELYFVSDAPAAVNKEKNAEKFLTEEIEKMHLEISSITSKLDKLNLQETKRRANISSQNEYFEEAWNLQRLQVAMVEAENSKLRFEIASLIGSMKDERIIIKRRNSHS